MARESAKAAVAECFRQNEPREVRLYGVPLMALAKAGGPKLSPAERRVRFDCMIRGGGYSRPEYVAALRRGIAAEEDPRPRPCGIVLRHPSHTPGAWTPRSAKPTRAERIIR